MHPSALHSQVRNAAAILARSLRGVTLRLVDASLSPPADVAAAVAVVLPLMIEQGLGSSVTEVQEGGRGVRCWALG